MDGALAPGGSGEAAAGGPGGPGGQSPALASDVRRPIIFLDIDGVLNRTRGATHIRLDEDLVARFRSLVEKSGADICLSTFWRAFDGYIAYVLSRYGIPEDRIIGRTPGRGHLGGTSALDEASYADRSEEITAWLAEHPEVTSFAILDDRETAGRGCLSSHFVHVDTSVGLSDSDVSAALQALTRPWSRDSIL
mmetsp:Transcript_130108/g.376417  ORF Transcript_130108/g.376417 Transcript_130108/m.376417 type:complete len:193 (-) Transcript_130108:86-664(-)